jgi:hypothetical protein
MTMTTGPQAGMPQVLEVRWELSLGGAVEVALVQVATGLGVALMALITAAGPGVDFVEGTAEIRQVNGRAASRFGARVAAVACLGLFSVLVTIAGLIAVTLSGHLRSGDELLLTVGEVDGPLTLAALSLIVIHASWIVALAQVLRTQAAQLAFPVGIVLSMFLLSRLISVPFTPDSWLGPLLELHAERSMLDFWWSVGGHVAWPWGNTVLLACLLVGAWIIGVRTDRLPRSP